MTFGSVFGRTFSPTFQPHSQAVASSGYTTWWTLDGAITSCVAAWQAKGVASYAASLDNLTGDATYDLVEKNGEVSWSTDDGWIGGSGKYFDTGLYACPSGESWSYIIKASNLYYSTNIIFGSYVGAKDEYALICVSTGIRADNGEIQYLDTSKPTSGVFSLAHTKYYRDGNYVGTSAVSVSKGDGSSVHILSRPDGSFSSNAKVQALAIYNSELTTQNIADLTTAINAL